MGGVGSGAKPKIYPPRLVAEVSRLYGAGWTQIEIAAALGLTQRIVQRLMARHGLPSRVAAKRDQADPANHMWAGAEAGYQAMHLRVKAARGKPLSCSRCSADRPDRRYEWANLTGRYEDVTDYERMCLPCHRRYDVARRAETGRRTSPVRRSA